MNLFSDVMLGTAKSSVFHKVRLWMEYAMLVVILALAAYAFWSYMQDQHRELVIQNLETAVKNSDARVQEVEKANKDQLAAIKTIQNLSQSQTLLVGSISEDLQKVALRDKNTAARIGALEKSNVALTRFLDAAIPTPVGCVLDNSCEKPSANGSQSAKPAAGTPQAVPTTGNRPR